MYSITLTNTPDCYEWGSRWNAMALSTETVKRSHQAKVPWLKIIWSKSGEQNPTTLSQMVQFWLASSP